MFRRRRATRRPGRLKWPSTAGSVGAERNRSSKLQYEDQVSTQVPVAIVRMRRQDARWRDLWLAALVVVVAASVVGPTTCQLVPPAAFNEFQLVGQAGAETRLPCLIGKQLHCGEPYFIAWYKFNATGRSWTRIEHLGRSEKAEPVGQRRHSAGALSSPLNDRVHFLWARSSRPANCPAGPSSQLSRFDCAQLSISSLEPLDEGQYKCEITFSESLDFDRCPASTLTELQVVGKHFD